MKRKLMTGLQLTLVIMVISMVGLAGCGDSVKDDGGGSGSGGGSEFLLFDSFQAASVVVGQADFISGDDNQGGVDPAANTVSDIFGNPVVHGGILYLSDRGNNRVLGFNSIPAINNADADFVLGQADFITTGANLTQGGMNGPSSLSVFDDQFFLTDFDYNRVTIYDSVPIAGGLVDAAFVVGQADFGLENAVTTSTGLNSPVASIAVAGKLIVTDRDNHRVMIWNTIPVGNGVAADIVLGQGGDFETNVINNPGGVISATSLFDPAGVWSDGTKLVVQDRGNNRVLIWNDFPTNNLTPADVVLGQNLFTTGTANNGGISASTLNFGGSGAVFSKDDQLFVADYDNNRVLIWDTFPTTNFAPADVVLGQADFDDSLANAGGLSATTLSGPSGLYVEGNQLIVADRNNHRYLIYEAL